MLSSRIILAILGLILLVLVVLSSSKTFEFIRNKIGIKTQRPQISETRITITPTASKSPEKGEKSNLNIQATETPNTGPINIIYLLLGGGLLTGAIINRFKG